MSLKKARPSGRGACHGRCSGLWRVRGFRKRQEAHQEAEGKDPGRAPEAGQEEPGCREEEVLPQACGACQLQASGHHPSAQRVHRRRTVRTRRPDVRRRSVCRQGCHTQGTALNQRTVPTAKVNLGPSLGSRDVAIGGALAAVVEFQDTYDGGALGNVNIKILPGNKTLTTSSVPLLWNNDITGPATLGRELRHSSTVIGAPGSALSLRRCSRSADGDRTDPGLRRLADRYGRYARATLRGRHTSPAGYNSLFYGCPANFGFGTGAGVPGYTVYTSGGSPNGVFLPVKPLRASTTRTTSRPAASSGNNDWIGTNPNPFPIGAPHRRALATPQLPLPSTTTRRTPCCAPTLCPWASPRAACR